MKLNLRSLGSAILVGLLVAMPVAYAAGLFPNLPIVGGASYSAGLVTVPAGPSLPLTGNELIPADTAIASGAAPQTVLVKPGALANFSQSVTSITASGSTFTPVLTSSRFFTATLTAGAPGSTFAAPTGLTNGQVWNLKVVQDATGGRTASWNSVYKWPSGTAPTLTSTASKADVFECKWDGSAHFCMTHGLNYTP